MHAKLSDDRIIGIKISGLRGIEFLGFKVPKFIEIIVLKFLRIKVSGLEGI
jgi:hypothetical protein